MIEAAFMDNVCMDKLSEWPMWLLDVSIGARSAATLRHDHRPLQEIPIRDDICAMNDSIKQHLPSARVQPNDLGLLLHRVAQFLTRHVDEVDL